MSRVLRKEDIIFEGIGRIVDEICLCNHLRSHHSHDGNLGCKECDCVKFSFSDRWVMSDMMKIPKKAK